MKISQKSIENAVLGLKSGESMLTYARYVANGKLEVEIAENVAGLPTSASLLAELNDGDPAFGQSGTFVRGWINGQPEKVQELFGFNIEDIDPIELVRGNGDIVEVYPILRANPSVSGEAVGVQIRESLEPMNDWQKANPSKAIKRTGTEGPQANKYLFQDDKPIYRSTTVQKRTAIKHVLIEHNQFRDSLADPMVVSTEETVEETVS